MSKKNWLFLAVISLIVTVIACSTFMRKIFIMPENGSLGTIKITATGEKNSLSAGTEVRIESIKINGEEVNLESVPKTGNWKMDGNLLVCYDVKKSDEITIPYDNPKEIDITFVKQSGSGMVEVKTDKTDEVLDMYSSAKEWGKEHWIDSVGVEFAPWRRIDLFFEIYIMFLLLLRLLISLKR